MDAELHFDKLQHPRLFAPAIISRRGFLALGAGVAGMAATSASAGISPLLCPPKVGRFGGSGDGLMGDSSSLLSEGADYSAEVPDDGPGVRFLKMVNPHNGETFSGNFVENGEYNQAVMQQFSHFARDWRRNESIPYAPATIEIIWKVWRKLDMSEPLRLNSGYRSPSTNGSLKGAASQSLHLRAMAADLSADSRSPAQVHKAAESVGGGGLGRYSTFTHVDCGRKRFWNGS